MQSVDITFPDSIPSVGQMVGQIILASIGAQTLPKPELGIRHAGNWPSDAVFGVEHTCHDKQFPEVKHGLLTDYFDSIDALQAWIDRKREWIVGTDYDFSMECKVYEWDLGPQFKHMMYL